MNSLQSPCLHYPPLCRQRAPRGWVWLVQPVKFTGWFVEPRRWRKSTCSSTGGFTPANHLFLELNMTQTTPVSFVSTTRLQTPPPPHREPPLEGFLCLFIILKSDSYFKSILRGVTKPRPHCSQESRTTASKVRERSLVTLMPCYVILLPVRGELSVKLLRLCSISWGWQNLGLQR